MRFSEGQVYAEGADAEPGDIPRSLRSSVSTADRTIRARLLPYSRDSLRRGDSARHVPFTITSMAQRFPKSKWMGSPAIRAY